MNACCKIPTEALSQPSEQYLVQNLTRVPIVIKSPYREADGQLLFEDGPVEALKYFPAEGSKPWLLISSKGSRGLPWESWLGLFDNIKVEIQRLTVDGWEAIDAKKPKG